jgi:hypothetical protein
MALHPMKALMRGFSYLFHGVLALFLLAISAVALVSGQPLSLGMLPWRGTQLTYWLLFGGLMGVLSLILALWRIWRGLFFLWCFAVLAIMVRGFFFSSYYFGGRSEFYRALYLTAGALLALWGAWSQLQRSPRGDSYSNRMSDGASNPR